MEKEKRGRERGKAYQAIQSLTKNPASCSVIWDVFREIHRTISRGEKDELTCDSFPSLVCIGLKLVHRFADIEIRLVVAKRGGR